MPRTQTVALDGVRLETDEGIALVLSLAERVRLGELNGIPASPAGLGLQAGGRLVSLADNLSPLQPRTVASLLDALLKQGGGGRAGGGVQLAIARALGMIDLPPFATVDEFLRILIRFAPPDRDRVLGALYVRLLTRRVDLLPLPPPLIERLPRRSSARAAALALAAVAALALTIATASVWRSSPAQDVVETTRAVSEDYTAGPPVTGSASGGDAPASGGSRRAAARPSRNGPIAVHAPGSAFSPSFAPGGEGVYFHTGPAGAASALVRSTTSPAAEMRLLRILDDGASNYHVRPSPDGRWIAFDSDRDGDRAVYVARADGVSVRRISGTGYAAVPSWSPEGQRLAFIKAEPGRPHVWNVWIADLRGASLKRITAHSYGQAWGASWFPDGHRVAYSHEDRLVVLDLQSGARRVFRSPQPGRLVRTPAVSPDGARIIYQVYRDGAWLLTVADGRARRVLADPSAEEFAWDPAGRRVAFHSRRQGGWSVWIMGTS